jgi:hypothetical protein
LKIKNKKFPQKDTLPRFEPITFQFFNKLLTNALKTTFVISFYCLLYISYTLRKKKGHLQSPAGHSDPNPDITVAALCLSHRRRSPSQPVEIEKNLISIVTSIESNQISLAI